MTRVKICGFTRADDALAAVEAGADYLGFIFYPSSQRYVQPLQAKKIVREVGCGRAKGVGVFVNEKMGRIQEIIREVGLRVVQLHGQESEEYCRDLAGKVGRVEIIKAFRIRDENDIKNPGKFPADFFLFDTYSPKFGGSGQAWDWGMLGRKRIARKRLFLSGGLNADNVGEAIRLVRPYAVDVASGVETSPGKKDRKKMVKFINRVKSEK